MQLVTYLGQETLFIIVAMVLFWCVDKRRGYYMMAVGFIGLAMNQILKLVFRIPRPWVRDPNFTVVESALPDANGYSFPSGHTQSASVVFGSLARWTERRWVRVASIAAMLLVAFSRMYLGVHTPADVTVSLIIGVVLSFALYPFFAKTDRDLMPLISALTIFAAVFVAVMQFYPFAVNADAVYFDETAVNAYKMLGSVVALAVSYPIEKKYIRFETNAPAPVQAVKLILGFSLTALIRGILKAPLAAILPDGAAGFIRYFMVVFFAGLVWPLSFKHISAAYNRLSKKTS